MGNLAGAVNAALKNQLLSAGSDPLESDIAGHVPTGWSLLDHALGGGFPLGRSVELFGEESTCKSSLVLQAIGHCQSMGGEVVLFEPETSLSKDFAQRLGVNLDQLLILSPQLYMEEFFSALFGILAELRKSVPLPAPIMVVWDSLPSTPTKAEVEAIRAGEDLARTTNPYRAQILRIGLRNLNPLLGRLSVSLVVINHVFDSLVGMTRGPVSNTPGGRSLKFLASARIHLWTGPAIRLPKATEGDPPVGTVVTAKLEKSKVGVPKRRIKSRFYYGRGFVDPWSIWDFLVGTGDIATKSSWHFVPAPGGGEPLRMYASGFPKAMASHPDLLPFLRSLALNRYDSLLPATEDE